jgi:ADP-heptose:LPS heptosyltransferase
LIISHTRIGDVLFRTSSLEHLKKGLPDCEWHYLAAPDSAEVLRGNPFLTSVLPLCHSTASLRLLPGAAEELRAMRLDVALCTNSESYWQDHKIALEARIANRVGFTHRGLSGLVTHAVPCAQLCPWAGYFRQMVAHVTGAAPDWPLTPMIYASEEDEQLALAQWKKMGLPGSAPVVACFMTTRERSQVWPKDCYRETIELIHQKSGAQIVLSGSKQDAPVLEQVVAGCRVPCKVMAGELGLRGLFCFLKRCAAVLAPDSGPRHIANAAGTPVVFIRNLFNSKIETGTYCQNEIDLSPDAEFITVDEQQTMLRRVTPTLVAQTILQLLRRR